MKRNDSRSPKRQVWFLPGCHFGMSLTCVELAASPKSRLSRVFGMNSLCMCPEIIGLGQNPTAVNTSTIDRGGMAYLKVSEFSSSATISHLKGSVTTVTTLPCSAKLSTPMK